MIKKPRDLILGLVMLAVSLYLLLSSNIVKGMTLLYTNITIAKPDTYIRILGGLLLLLSAALVLRALGVFGRQAEAETRKKKPVDWLIAAGFAVLLVYIPLMKLIGFTASSILLTACFTFMIRAREKQVDLRSPQALLKNLGISAAYGVALVLVLELLFTKALHVRLP